MATSAPDPLTAALQQIRGLIEAGELQPAAEALNAVQDKAPTDPRVPLVGMRLAQRAGNIKGATEAARRAVQLAPDWHVAQLELGLLLARQGQSDEAMQLAMNAMAALPNDARTRAAAINVALYAGHHEQMMKWAEEGVRRLPDNPGIRTFLAQRLTALGQHEDALAHYAYIHERVPAHQPTLQAMLSCALAMRDDTKAQTYADALLELDPDGETTCYWHAMAHGKVPSTQPASVVRDIFDNQAENYDLHMVRRLQYRIPERIAAILLDRHPDRRFNLLDLGCGTGLVGLYLDRLEGHIVGVDLSDKMIEQAARHNVYSRFHRVNVLDALRETPAQEYEAITAADVFIYVGELTSVIPNALRILKPGGHFVFTCESVAEDDPDDMVLRPETNRYAHKASVVEQQCRDAGFDDVHIEDLPTLRLEAGQAVAGFLVTARKPRAA